MTRKQENENKRTEILKKIWALIESEGDEVIQIKKNEIAFPFVYDNGDESFVKIAVSIPSGSRDGDIFDAYSLGEEFKINEKKKAEIAERKPKRKRKKLREMKTARTE